MKPTEFLQVIDKMTKDIRIELLNELEKYFVKGFDDFHDSWTIKIDRYNDIKKRYSQ